jgi:hypothetical protein
MIWKYEKYLFDLRLAFVSFKMKNQRKEFFSLREIAMLIREEAWTAEKMWMIRAFL